MCDQPVNISRRQTFRNINPSIAHVPSLCAAYAHGAVVFNTVYVAAALAGVPMENLLRHREARLLWAAMIREGLQVG